MLPNAPIPNVDDLDVVDAELLGNGSKTELSSTTQTPDHFYLHSGELRHMVLQADQHRSMPRLVQAILALGLPLQITRSVVGDISVSMSHFVLRRGPGAVKGYANSNMNPMVHKSCWGLPFGAQRHMKCKIWRGAAGAWLQYFSRLQPLSAIVGLDPPIHRPHTSKAGRLIAGMVWDRTPFFHGRYDSLSPHRPQDGITALAARV